jgi:hypothetical protein
LTLHTQSPSTHTVTTDIRRVTNYPERKDFQCRIMSIGRYVGCSILTNEPTRSYFGPACAELRYNFVAPTFIDQSYQYQETRRTSLLLSPRTIVQGLPTVSTIYLKVLRVIVVIILGVSSYLSRVLAKVAREAVEYINLKNI